VPGAARKNSFSDRSGGISKKENSVSLLQSVAARESKRTKNVRQFSLPDYLMRIKD
jgi:hypothetical protein